MNNNLTEIGVVLDRSGSMSGVVSDAIGGFNTFLETQKEIPGDANITVSLFDDVIEYYVKDTPVKSVAPLTKITYVPRGMTALYDAIGVLINDFGKKFSNMKEEDRPAKVIIAILTDGAENASKEFTENKIFDMIKTQRDTYNWEFIFLAAGESAMTEGANIGMSMTKCAQFVNDSAGNTAAYTALCSYTRSLRGAVDMTSYNEIKTNSVLQDMVDAQLSSSN